MSKHFHPDLKPRAIDLLILVADHTAGGAYFVPKAKPMWSDTLRRFVDVGGSGDASSFRALQRRGLIELQNLASYSYAVTEMGRRVAAVFAAKPAHGGK